MEQIQETDAAEHCEVLWDDDFKAITNDEGVKTLLEHLSIEYNVPSHCLGRKNTTLHFLTPPGPQTRPERTNKPKHQALQQ